jgi:nicotinamide phosphoribosyltransferase
LYECIVFFLKAGLCEILMVHHHSNFILNVDSYKTSHYAQYPPDITHISSYVEPRSGDYAEVVFFGLQLFIKKYLTSPITLDQVKEAKALLAPHGVCFYEAGWQHIINAHGGYLPLKIEALPEGTVVSLRQVLTQVVNTDPQCAWLTTYIETALLRALWYPTTVATLSRYCKGIIHQFLELTADNTSGLPFKLHDFGARGASSEEAAAIGGLAHLVNFQGTDTLSALVAAKRYYFAECAGFSIPAAEHSTITSWGEANEIEAYKHIINQFLTAGRAVAVVSDSYNLWRAIDEYWGTCLREQVLSSGGTLIVRPDSGDPLEVAPECIEKLMQRFGFYTNTKGYRVLPDAVRVIQGDGISPERIRAILSKLASAGISADNITFGMGAELLQKVNRDTLGFAMKASAIKNGGDLWHDIFKKPATDIAKASKPGRWAVIKTEQGEYQSIPEAQLENRENQLRCVFEKGELLIDDDFESIRQRAVL